MWRPLRVPVLVVMSACLPEKGPEDGATPEIRLLYPTNASPVEASGEGADCTVELLVVVDILNLDFVPPSQATGAVDGEGHWHFEINGDKRDRPEALWAEETLVGDRFCPGSTLNIRVALANGAHLDLDEFPTWEAVSEPEIVAEGAI